MRIVPDFGDITVIVYLGGPVLPPNVTITVTTRSLDNYLRATFSIETETLADAYAEFLRALPLYFSVTAEEADRAAEAFKTSARKEVIRLQRDMQRYDGHLREQRKQCRTRFLAARPRSKPCSRLRRRSRSENASRENADLGRCRAALLWRGCVRLSDLRGYPCSPARALPLGARPHRRVFGHLPCHAPP